LKVKNIQKKRLLDDFFKIDDVYLQFEKFSGDWSEQVRRLNIERGEAAAVLIYLQDKDSLIFVRQFRYAVYAAGESGWIDEIVAGVLDNDSPIECARRECIEEAGYVIEDFDAIGTFYVSPGITNERIHLYIGRCMSSDKKYEGGGLEEESEDILVTEMNCDMARQKLKEGYFSDGKTILALQHFFLNS